VVLASGHLDQLRCFPARSIRVMPRVIEWAAQVHVDGALLRCIFCLDRRIYILEVLLENAESMAEEVAADDDFMPLVQAQVVT
jgi:hypothetical protein